VRRNTELIMHTPLHVYTVTLCSLSLFVLLSKALFPHSKFTCGQQRGKGLVLGIAESNFELLRGGLVLRIYHLILGLRNAVLLSYKGRDWQRG